MRTIIKNSNKRKVVGNSNELPKKQKEPYTARNLEIDDKFSNALVPVKYIIMKLTKVYALAGVDDFEEMFKLFFIKFFDEYCSRKDNLKIQKYLNQKFNSENRADYKKQKLSLKNLNDKNYRNLEFRNTEQTQEELENKIHDLFDRAKKQWPGIFPNNSSIELSAIHLEKCVSILQDVKLLNASLSVMDEIFECLVHKSAKSQKGQFFTPRHVIDMCVKMLNPKPGENVLDPACGSGGFLVHSSLHTKEHFLSNAVIPDGKHQNLLNVYGIDYDERAVRVARFNMYIMNGESNVMRLNSLDYRNWRVSRSDPKWCELYENSFSSIVKFRTIERRNKQFGFDIVVANPPFAGYENDSRIINEYKLGIKNGKTKKGVNKVILFVERCHDFLKPGGRMAIVLPRSTLSNCSDKYVREYIDEHFRILCVVNLDDSTFKPYTGTKTSVIFVQKWDTILCPRIKEYLTLFEVSKKGGKNSSGDYIYKKCDNDGFAVDFNGQKIIDHDLHNHKGELNDGIAEKFIKLAKEQKLSFWL